MRKSRSRSPVGRSEPQPVYFEAPAETIEIQEIDPLPVLEQATRDHAYPGTSIVVRIDYRNTSALLNRVGMAGSLQQLCAALGQTNADLGRRLAETFTPSQLAWLVRALTIYGANAGKLTELGVDLPTVVRRLIKVVRRGVLTPPGTPGDGFVNEVVLCGGWMQASLCSVPMAVRPQILTALNRLYFPGGLPGRPQVIGPLNPELLRTGLRKSLTRVLDQQLRPWDPPPGERLERVDFTEVRRIADFLEGFICEVLAPFPLAYADGPLYGAPYSGCLTSSEEVAVDHDGLLGWMENRGTRVGRDPAYEAPMTAANYHPGRTADQESLRQIYADLLSDADFARKVGRLINHTPQHAAADGMTYLLPCYPNPAVQSRAEWRWRMTRTMIHEFMHRITHPNVVDAAQHVHQPQILKEGFVEVFTALVLQRLSDHAAADQDVRDLILGPGTPWTPAPEPYLRVGYGQDGADAQQITKVLGRGNVAIGYFLGDVRRLAIMDTQ
ncbi:hypothetical protein [Herbidospora sp. NBRC 101105]|uniref:hypothetical protein n=1 Tax=Herbidospora sp. NBRC 101105 TaxID=3032195 RepID=UPI00249FE959|nr:hypothetical protein [Herbidospora sp. NBRC 101105]GLX95355.1 hypothetical protein Hesp01_33050 [Herbidospora sp. NBRC 101105]